MNIIILGGFLGSGKTSVLLQLANFLVNKEKDNAGEIKVAIIENEVGQIGIDDKILNNAGYRVNSLFAGCVCCSLNAELLTSINNIQETLNPKWLIIESTGVAYPGSIRKAILDYLKFDSTIITIVDAKRWKRLTLALETLVKGQLEDSALVFVNKIDLINDTELVEVKESILHYNQEVEIISLSAKESLSDEFFDSIVKRIEGKGYGQ